MSDGRTAQKNGLSLMVRILIINVFVLALVIVGAAAKPAAAAGAAAVLLYLLVKAVQQPEEAVFLAFGVKLTFDALWDISFFTAPLVGSVGPLDLFVLVILALAFLGPRGEKKWAGRLYALPVAYLLWTVTAAAANGIAPNPEVILRQAGILFGIVVGVKYIRKREDMEKMILAVFLSTLVPVLASALDVMLGPAGISIFHYKTSTIRGVRLSGLYYDSATTGMMAIVAAFTGLYIFGRQLLPARTRAYQVAFIVMALAVIVSGGTRSVTLVAILGMAILMTKNRKTVLYVMPLLLVLAYFTQPFVKKMMARTEFEVEETIRIGRVLDDTSYRRLFTGRVGLWQDIWAEFNEGSALQVLFGHGRTSNAHSAYFFLLLQIGWLGLGLFFFMHLVFFKGIWLSGADPPLRNFALVCHLAYLMVGLAMATVMYTSFQWVLFLFIAGVTTGLAPSKEKDEDAEFMAEAGKRDFVPAEGGAEEGGVEGDLLPPALSPRAGGRKETYRLATAYPEPFPERHDAAGGTAGGGEPPLRTRSESFEFFATSSRWFVVAAVPALIIGGLWLYGQKGAARREQERTARMEALLPSVAAPRPTRSARPPEPIAGIVDETVPVATPEPLPPVREQREPAIPGPPDFDKPPADKKSVPEPPPEPPFDAPAALAAAAALAEEGRIAEAEEAYREIVARDPRVHEAYMALGDIALDRGDYQGATKYFRLAEAFTGSVE